MSKGYGEFLNRYMVRVTNHCTRQDMRVCLMQSHLVHEASTLEVVPSDMPADTVAYGRVLYEALDNWMYMALKMRSPNHQEQRSH